MRDRTKSSLATQLPEYEFIQERILRVLSLHDDGLSINRLTRAVAQTMPPEYGERLSGLRQQVRSAVFDLKLSGVLDSVANYACLRSEEKPSLRAAASCGNIRILEELLAEAADQDEKNEALISAVINNQLTAVEMLIAAGADVNAKDNLFGRTAIMYVTKRTRKEIVRLLGAAGADASQNSA